MIACPTFRISFSISGPSTFAVIGFGRSRTMNGIPLRCRGLHRHRHGPDEGVRPGADVLHVEEENVDPASISGVGRCTCP